MSESSAQHDRDSHARIAALEAELATLRQARDQAEHEREQYRKLYTLVLYELGALGHPNLHFEVRSRQWKGWVPWSVEWLGQTVADCGHWAGQP
jgi:hypothetical protein